MAAAIKNILAYLVIILAFVALILWLYGKSCNTPMPVAKPDMHDSLLKVIQNDEAILKQKNDSVKVLKVKLDSLYQQQQIVRIKLDSSRNVNRKLLNDYQEAKKENNYAVVSPLCDALEQTVDRQDSIIAGYEYLSDSLIKSHIALYKIQDSSYTALNQAYFGQQLYSQKLETNNKELTGQTIRLGNRLKTQKTISGYLIVATGVLATFFFLKK
jgi:hypothetical protein